jgi:hypothetical protein
MSAIAGTATTVATVVTGMAMVMMATRDMAAAMVTIAER